MRESLRVHLSLEGYECDARSNFEDVMTPGATNRFALAVVNLLTTRGRGLERTAVLESMGVPTLLLAGPGSEEEALSALERWAADYVILPVEMRELIARAHALIRRINADDRAALPPGGGSGGAIVHDGFLIDPSRRHVEVGKHTLPLTEFEFQLLYTLARRPGVVLTRRTLLSELWGADTLVPPRSIDALVMRLRRRLRTVASGWEVATLRRIGYQLKNRAHDQP
ncbi:MAG: response regulator transcription factor [Acidobacteriota bacterium]